MDLTAEEKQLLTFLENSKAIPIVCFELKNSKEASISSTALKHVWITDHNDSMEKVKARTSVLQKLEEDGVVHIHYSSESSKGPLYQIYYESELFSYFSQVVEEGKLRTGFLFDIPSIKEGIVTLADREK